MNAKIGSKFVNLIHSRLYNKAFQIKNGGGAVVKTPKENSKICKKVGDRSWI